MKSILTNNHFKDYRKYILRRCYICKSRENREVHHINWNSSNNNPSNLITLCKTCHLDIHIAGIKNIQSINKIKQSVWYSKMIKIRNR